MRPNAACSDGDKDSHGLYLLQEILPFLCVLSLDCTVQKKNAFALLALNGLCNTVNNTFGRHAADYTRPSKVNTVPAAFADFCCFTVEL